MTRRYYYLEFHDDIPNGYEAILLRGLAEEAHWAKGFAPIQSFGIFIKDDQATVVGGIFGSSFYGCLYVDTLWISQTLRHQGWGTKLMRAAETIGIERGTSFVSVNTMDWEALPFYQKLGYTLEFIREGYEKESKMYMLRKDLPKI